MVAMIDVVSCEVESTLNDLASRGEISSAGTQVPGPHLSATAPLVYRW